jgi:glycosyltransferase involved in cell wall biosynthesis
MYRILSINKNYDKIFIYAPSPITVGFLGFFAAKKFMCKSYLWVHDLWPESVKVAGGIDNRLILYLINLMTKLIYSLNDIILVQSPYFEKYLIKQGVNKEKIIYYPYYAEDFYKPVKKKLKILKKFPKGFNILFAGNLGVAQSLKTLVSAIGIIRERNINIIFLGDGRYKSILKKYISELKLEEKFYFLGSYPPEIMPEFFSCADALYISLKKANIFSYTIPGKLQSYLACGKPILGSLDGIGKKIIIDSNSGLCSNAEDHIKLSKNIIELSEMSEAKRNLLSKNAIKYFRANFEKEMLMKQLIEIFN